MVDDPTLAHDARRSAEERLFEILESLKFAEQAERDIDESIVSIGQLQSQVRSNENTELIVVFIVVVVLAVISR